MTEATRIRQHAIALGWHLHRRNGNHEIWISPSKNKMPLPSTPGKGRCAAELSGYIQMLDGEWGHAEPFELSRAAGADDDRRADKPSFSQQSREILSYFEPRAKEDISLRQLTQAIIDRREGLTSQRSMMAALAPLLDGRAITETDEGNYRLL